MVACDNHVIDVFLEYRRNRYMSRDKAIELAEEYLRSYEDIKVHIEILKVGKEGIS